MSSSLSVPFFAKATFLIEGFAALIAWNSILTAFDFFHLCYPSSDVAFTLTIPIYIGQTFFALFIYKISQYITLNSRIVSSLSLMAVILVVLPLVSHYFRTNFGFWVCSALMLLIGAGNSLMQSSGIALVALFPPKCISYFFTGTGLAGILIGVLRLIILSIFGDKTRGIVVGTIIYFSTSGFFLLLTIIVHFCFRRTLFCQYYIKKARSRTLLHQEEFVDDLVLGPIDVNMEILKEINKADTVEEILLKNLYESDLKSYPHKPMRNASLNLKVKSETKNSEAENKKNLSLELEISSLDLKNNLLFDSSALSLKPNDEKNTWKFIYKVMKKIHPFPFLCWMIFLQTFLMFPGVSLKKHLSGMTFSISSTVLILVFNIFDTVGKYASDLLPKPRIRTFIIIILLRFLMFPLFLMMVQMWNVSFIKEDWFALVNMGIFAVSHGFIVSNLMICAPEKADDNEKETAGFMMSLPLTVGIVSGSLLALSFAGL